MKKICLEELKKIELNILIYIDQVCKNNNLRYYLCGGTLLGALRHKGFIPWDDDIDICMPRPDYDAFIEIIKRNDRKYKILNSEQENYYYNFSKVIDSETILIEYNYQPIEGLGVYVDVFPLEGMPMDEEEREKHFIALNKIRRRINSYALFRPKIRKNLLQYIKSVILYEKNKKVTISKFQKEYEQLTKQYHFDESEYVYASGGAYGKKDIFRKDFFSGFTEVEFEGRRFWAPKECEAYLKQLYGDYMQLPPVDKRVSNHNYEAKYR